MNSYEYLVSANYYLRAHSEVWAEKSGVKEDVVLRLADLITEWVCHIENAEVAFEDLIDDDGNELLHPGTDYLTTMKILVEVLWYTYPVDYIEDVGWYECEKLYPEVVNSAVSLWAGIYGCSKKRPAAYSLGRSPEAA